MIGHTKKVRLSEKCIPRQPVGGGADRRECYLNDVEFEVEALKPLVHFEVVPKVLPDLGVVGVLPRSIRPEDENESG